MRPQTPLSSPALELLTRFHAVKTSWVAACRRVESADSIDWQRVSATGLHGAPYGPATANRLATICREQDRLRGQFIADVCRALGDHVRVAASALNCPNDGSDDDAQAAASARGHALLMHEGHRWTPVDQLVAQYSRTAQGQLERQDFELRGAMTQDAIAHPAWARTATGAPGTLKKPSVSLLDASASMAAHDAQRTTLSHPSHTHLTPILLFVAVQGSARTWRFVTRACSRRPWSSTRWSRAW